MKIQPSKVPKFKENILQNPKVLKRTYENDNHTSKIPRIDGLCSIKKTSNITMDSTKNPSTFANHRKSYAQINKITCQKILTQRTNKGAYKENLVNKNFNVNFKKKRENKILHVTKSNITKKALKIHSPESLCPNKDTTRRVSIYYSSNLQLSFTYNNGVKPPALTEIDVNRQSICDKPTGEDVFTALEKFDFVKNTPRGKPDPPAIPKGDSLVNRLSIYQNSRPAAHTPTKKALYANCASSQSSALLNHITPQRQCPKLVTAPPSSTRPAPPNSIYRPHNILHNSLSALSSYNATIDRYALKMNGLLSQSYSYKCPSASSSLLVSLDPDHKKGDEAVVKGSILKKAPVPEFEDSLLGCNKVEKKKKVVKWKDDVPIQSPFAARNSGFKHKSPPPQLFTISIPAHNESKTEVDICEFGDDTVEHKKEPANDENEIVPTEDFNVIPDDPARRDGAEKSPGADILTEKLDMLELSDIYSYLNFEIPAEKSLNVPSAPASLLDNSLLRAFDPLVSS